MKIRNLAFVILSSTIAFSSVAADANYTTDRMQKPAIEQTDTNQVLQDQPSCETEDTAANERQARFDTFHENVAIFDS